MKVITADLNNRHFRLIPENGEDLWHLSLFINKGDIIESRSRRKIKKDDSKKQIIKTIYVKISAEKVEFRKDSNEVKVLGRIIESSEEISGYHSLHIIENEEFEITKKEINKIILNKILEKENNDILFGTIFDNHEAILFEIMSKRVNILEKKKINYGKQYTNKKNQFDDLFKLIDEYVERKPYKNIILGYSIFWNKTVSELIESKKWKKQIVWVNINNPTESGIFQLLKSEELKNLLKDFRIQLEENLLNEALKRMKSGKRINYGKVVDEIDKGNVEKLIISEDLLLEDFEKYGKILKKTEKYKGEVVIVETEDVKKTINNLGGIIAFLRY